MEYLMVVEYKHDKFNLRVNNMMQEGWGLYGSPSVNYERGSASMFSQAMVRKTTETTH